MPQITDPTYLEVNGVPLATPAWRITDLSPLLDLGPFKGGNKSLPLATGGDRPYPRRKRTVTRTLPMDIFGDFDIEGEDESDPVQGVINHMIYLAQNLGAADDATNEDGTVEAVWHLPNSSLLFAHVHVEGLLGTTDVAPGVLRTTLDLSFPYGGFYEVVAS